MHSDSSKNPLDKLHSTHTREAIRERLEQGYKHSYLRDFVYGAVDGTVTTFAVVSGVAGAKLAAGIVIILGVANLIGDGFSMAISNFLATRADQELRVRARKEEEHHIQTIPEGEREEIRQIYSAKGFKGEDLERIVNVITSDVKLWVDTMIQEEFGMSVKGPNPWRAAISTFTAFVLVGLLPLVAFIIELFSPGTISHPFIVSSIMTAVAFFVVGASKARFIGEPWIVSGFETLAVGGSAAFLAYLVGMMLRGVALS